MGRSRPGVIINGVYIRTARIFTVDGSRKCSSLVMVVPRDWCIKPGAKVHVRIEQGDVVAEGDLEVRHRSDKRCVYLPKEWGLSAGDARMELTRQGI